MSTFRRHLRRLTGKEPGYRKRIGIQELASEAAVCYKTMRRVLDYESDLTTDQAERLSQFLIANNLGTEQLGGFYPEGTEPLLLSGLGRVNRRIDDDAKEMMQAVGAFLDAWDAADLTSRAAALDAMQVAYQNFVAEHRERT